MPMPQGWTKSIIPTMYVSSCSMPLPLSSRPARKFPQYIRYMTSGAHAGGDAPLCCAPLG